MNKATATFHDLYFGEVAVILVPFRTKISGQRVIRFRWEKAEGVEGCITTGFRTAGFPTADVGIAAAGRHARFQQISRA